MNPIEYNSIPRPVADTAAAMVMVRGASRLAVAKTIQTREVSADAPAPAAAVRLARTPPGTGRRT